MKILSAGRPSSRAAAPAAADPRRWAVLAVASAAQFLAVLDVSAVNVAFPVIGEEFSSASAAGLSWVLNGYTIVLAALLVPAGRLADTAGRRRSFLLGLALFGLASVGCGLAPGLSWLVAARIVQGVGAAVLVPTSLSLALPAFPAAGRATAVGAWTAISALAASGGPVLGGVLAASDWRWVFLINVPVVLAALAAGVRLLPDPAPGLGQGRDPLGTVLVLVAVGALTTAVVEAGDWGRTSSATLGTLAAGVLAAALAVRHVRRVREPVVDPRLFATRGFTAAALGLFAYFLAYSAMLLAASTLCSDVWGWSVRRTGQALAPWPCTVLAVSALSGRIVAAVGDRAAAAFGALCFTAAPLWWLAAVGDRAHYAAALLPGLVLAGVGTALCQSVMFAAAGRLPERRMSLGSGVLMVSRQAGTALGVAVLVGLGGGAHRLGLGTLRAGWVFAAATAALALAAALTFRRGGRGEDGRIR
ncbi:MFS transporter [Streptomyces caatingaensis]|uniref:Multidrug transporter n=1 Tax=Streptomyces caatingaensis TaxID=1678637 RepID=A0A0K9XNA6_9ACTN|nr:MFS transporter [Streptomyces caatingaensis]KNB54157.1 multidrug transporter [Streptomyces caatingaensis]